MRFDFNGFDLSKRWFYILVMAIFALSTGYKIWHLSEKEGLHLDEISNVRISDHTDAGWGYYPQSGEFTGAEYKDLIWYSDASLSDAFRDIKKLWIDNNDPPHTNLYYTLSRIANIGVDHVDIPDYKLRMGILHFIIFSLLFLVTIKFALYIFKDDYLMTLLMLAMTFLNTAEMAMFIFFRPYLLQMLFFTLTAFMYVKIIDQIKSEEYNINDWRNAVKYIFATTFTLLAGYYALILIGLFALVVIWHLYRYQQLNKTQYFFGCGIIGLALCWVFYPSFHKAFFCYRAIEVFDGETLTSDFLQVTISLICDHIYYLPVCIMCFAATTLSGWMRGCINTLKSYCYIPLVGLLFSFATIYIAPYNTDRYIAAAIPLLALFTPMLFFALKRSIAHIFALATILFFLLAPCMYANAVGVYYYKENDFRRKLNSTYSNNVYLILSSDFPQWMVSPQIPYINDNLKLVICKTTEEFNEKINDEEKFAVISNPDYIKSNSFLSNLIPTANSSFFALSFFEIDRIE